MIIEAGYDLMTLLFDGRFRVGSLRVVSLDGDFRVTSIDEVAGTIESASLEAVDAAIPDHDPDDEIAVRYAVRYAALGLEVPTVEGYLERIDWEHVRRIEGWLDCRGIELLGIQISDGERWASTGPMKTFDTYLGSENYPRVLVIRAPHPDFTCECVVCASRRETLERARVRARAQLLGTLEWDADDDDKSERSRG